MKKVSLKEVFESDSWIITSIHQGLDGRSRIDAKRRFMVADGINLFSVWGKNTYINRLALENYGKNINEFNCYRY